MRSFVEGYLVLVRKGMTLMLHDLTLGVWEAMIGRYIRGREID
jgi:hypothetical protein